jgi:hypothetical protein
LARPFEIVQDIQLASITLAFPSPDRIPLTPFEEAVDLFRDTLHIVLKLFGIQSFPFSRSSGRISYETRCSTYLT